MKAYKHFTALINYKMVLLGLTNEKAAEKVGMCMRTWADKKKDPRKMTLGEVVDIFDTFKFTEDEQREALYGG